MTIGPDPMTATVPISERLGNGRSQGAGGGPVDEGGQGGAGVMRPGPGLGMELERRNVEVAQREPLDRAVVERRVRDRARAERRRELASGVRAADGEAVVLRRHEDTARLEVEHGVVGAAMPEAELVGLEPEGCAQELMAQADAEDRQGADEAPDLRDRGGERGPDAPPP